MDKVVDLIDTTNTNSILINERKSIIINGVKKIDSFDDEEFLLETGLGYLIIKGENLEIIKLDTYQGNVSIKGMLKSLSYVDDIKSKTNKDEGIFNRLFK
jgi:sporulation protein YabP